MLLDNGLTDLTTGYDAVRRLPLALAHRWRTPLLKAYAVRHAAYLRQRGEYRRRWRTLSLWALLVVVVAAADLGAGWLLLARGVRWGLALMALGVVVGAAALVVWWVVTLRPPPQAPPHPLHPPLRDRLLAAPLPRWRAALTGQFDGDGDRYGTEGEWMFVRDLQTQLSDAYLVLHSLQLRHGDDVDVVVLGLSGVWVFEVKYWSGTIVWENGVWRHEKTYHERGGAETTEGKDIGQPPDEQWRRMARDVARTLGTSAPWLASRVPELTRVRGGLVFASRNAEYRIPRDSPFRWGTLRGWSEYIKQADPLPGMDAYAVLRAAEVLLARHQALNPAQPTRSMVTVADNLAEEATANVRSWIVRHSSEAER